MIALSDAGIPFKDPFLDFSGSKISKNRSIERKNARGTYKFSSAVKSPTFLGKDVGMDSKVRRVLRNINQLNIDNLKSKKAYYLICCQSNSCFCGCNVNKISNSRDRINMMSGRLSEICRKEILFHNFL